MVKVYLFGAGRMGKKALDFYGVDAVGGYIDNDKTKIGTLLYGKVVMDIAGFKREKEREQEVQLVISNMYVGSVVRQLRREGISDFIIFPGLFIDEEVPIAERISHEKWSGYLKELCDNEGNEILEVGSRMVTGANHKLLFQKANYTGFDYYSGPNVDVVGDAHKLSFYFNKQFDLIFSSAVFEHLAMPWVAAREMIKLLKPGGYIFVETHYCYGSHERPWHFFQFSEKALKVLFSEAAGIKCIEAGVSNPIDGYFSLASSEYLRGKAITGLYAHAEFLGQKVGTEGEGVLWDKISLKELVGEEVYPRPECEKNR